MRGLALRCFGQRLRAVAEVWHTFDANAARGAVTNTLCVNLIETPILAHSGGAKNRSCGDTR